MPLKKRRRPQLRANVKNRLLRTSPEPKRWRYSYEIAKMIEVDGVTNKQVWGILKRLKNRPIELKNVMMWLEPRSRRKVEEKLEEMRGKKR